MRKLTPENRQRIAEFVKFGIVGTTAMVIHYAVYFLLLPAMDKNVAYTIGYFLSFLCNYVMSSYFTFRVKPSLRRFFRFLCSHGVNYFVYLGLFNFFCWVGVPAEYAPLPVYLIAVPVSFILVRYALRPRKDTVSPSPPLSPPKGGGVGGLKQQMSTFFSHGRTRRERADTDFLCL